MRALIVSRHTATKYGRSFIVRFLACGHEQVQPRGGKAATAVKALCLLCSARSARSLTRAQLQELRRWP